MTKEEKKRYHRAYSVILDNYKFDNRYNGIDMEFMLKYYVERRPIEEIRSSLKKNFKIDDATANDIIRKTTNQFDYITKELKMESLR